VCPSVPECPNLHGADCGRPARVRRRRRAGRDGIWTTPLGVRRAACDGDDDGDDDDDDDSSAAHAGRREPRGGGWWWWWWWWLARGRGDGSWEPREVVVVDDDDVDDVDVVVDIVVDDAHGGARGGGRGMWDGFEREVRGGGAGARPKRADVEQVYGAVEDIY